MAGALSVGGRVVVEEEMVETIVGLVCCHEELDLIF